MTMLEWGALGELVGGFAIIVSLIYVGVQVKESSRAARSAAANDATVSIQSWYLEVGSNRQTSDLWFNAVTSPEPLSTHDEFQFMIVMHAAMLGFQNSYVLIQEGTLDPEIHESITNSIVAINDLPGMKRYWSQRRSFFRGGFVKYVDDLMARDSIDSLEVYKKHETAQEQ